MNLSIISKQYSNQGNSKIVYTCDCEVLVDVSKKAKSVFAVILVSLFSVTFVAGYS